MQPTQVLIVDDSALIRRTLTEIFATDPRLRVVGAVADPYFARDAIKRLSPDVLTLDIEMPRMDGITFLGKLMKARPMPVVVVSSLAEEHAEVTLQALELGAITCVEKPKLNLKAGLEAQARELIEAVVTAAFSRVCRPAAAGRIEPSPALREAPPVARRNRHLGTSERVVAIGASTGGTCVIQDILASMPPDCPGIVIVQHMPGGYTGPFAERLDRLCPIQVREARDGDRIIPGLALLAPAGTHHTEVKRSGANYHVRLIEGPRVNRHIPSVDVLFASMAREVGPNGVGVILTGMGDDGAAELGEMRRAGAVTIAQDEASSVVFGMPKEAIRRGAVECVVGRTQLTTEILKHAGSKVRV